MRRSLPVQASGALALAGGLPSGRHDDAVPRAENGKKGHALAKHFVGHGLEVKEMIDRLENGTLEQNHAVLFEP